jgi:GPH family glycoside/pentoside/hexuronide:cation symporter
MSDEVESQQCSDEYKYSTKDHISFGFGYFMDCFLTGALGVRLFAFYENELLLPVFLVLIAFLIYAVWNMINDPIIGYLADRPNRLWKKWGRRFPWILIAILPWPLVYLLVFISPPVSQVGIWFVFLWLVIIICIFDGLYSAWNANFYSLYPDKYRSHKERTKVAGIGTAIGQIGIALGFILPPLFIVYGDLSTYIIAAIVVSIIAWIGILVMIPGVREDEEMRARILLLETKQKQESFFKTMKYAVKQKNFIIYIMAYLCFQSFVFIILGSLPYFVPYILNASAEMEALLSAGFLIGSLASIAIWAYLVKKFGNRKIYIVGMFLTGVILIPLLFITDVMITTLIFIFLGIGVGAIWICVYPIYGDVIDEIVVETEKREEAVYFGIRIFFARIAYIVGAVVFALLHISTGFDPALETQTDLALLGLRLQMALIPMLFLFLGGFIFWKWYDLKPDKVESIKSRLKELGI